MTEVQTFFKSAPSPRRGLSRPKRLTSAEKAVRAAVFDRDGGCLLADYSPCFGPLTPHHRKKASQGGKYTLDNLAALCSHHNGLIESDADCAAHATAVGLVLRASA